MAATSVESKARKGTEPAATSRSETVLLALRDMITRGEFAAGFHLQENPLAERLGVSRTPIREALTMLSKEGLLEPGPKRGYKIRSFSIEEIVDAYEMRATLEGAACRLLAERGLEEDLVRRVRELLDFGDQMLERGIFTSIEQAPWSDMNNKFHELLVDTSGNTLLKSFIEQSYRVPLAGAQHVHWYRFDNDNFELARHAHRDHHEIFNAIIRRQSGRAEARMREHIYFSLDLVRQHFRSQTVGFDTVIQLQPSADGRPR